MEPCTSHAGAEQRHKASDGNNKGPRTMVLEFGRWQQVSTPAAKASEATVEAFLREGRFNRDS